MTLPLVIDVLDFARNAGLGRGKIVVSSLRRLQDYLVGNSGELGYSVIGALDANGRPVLHIDIQGAVSLQCQRCLEELEHALDVHTELLLAQK